VLSPANVVSNPYALLALGLTTALQVLAVEFQPLAHILRTHALDTDDWLVLGGLAMLPAVLGQVVKLVTATDEASTEQRS
jgi:hypothetical protein